MEIEKWSDIAPSFIRVPITAYKYRTTIQKWWKKALAYANVGDTNVVVLGRPSVGKSVMMAYLYGESNDMSWKLPLASRDVEIGALTLGKWTKLIRVIPGQNVDERHKGLDESLRKNKNLEGIIYVVDWGYTDVKDATSKSQMIAEGIDSMDKLRDLNLKRELEDFKYICRKIVETFALGATPKWLLIAVNKADLFFDKNELDAAQNYYHPGGTSEFSQAIQQFVSEVGEQRIKCASLPLSSYEKDMEWNGETAQTRIKGEENRKALAMNFFKIISNF